MNPHHMSSITNGRAGILYCMTNASMPGLVKLGVTTDTAANRAKQLTAATASPTPFYVVYQKPVADCNEAEAKVHAALDSRRVNDRREFFEASVYEAAVVMDRVCGGERFKPKPLTPFSELFASFPDDGGDRTLTPEEQARCRQLEKGIIV
jgi:hypothetical protein